LLFIPSHPSILNITSAITKARKYLIAHGTGTITISRATMGRQKKQGYQFPHNKILVQEPEGNEENRYSDQDSNKMMINYAKKPNEAHKNNFKKDILQVLNENFIEMILNMVNQNIQETLKKFQDNKNREFEEAKEELKETKEALYKHQSERQNTINKQISELRTKIDNIEEEMTQEWKT
jgi:Ni,Fe-hydrogenase I large subunit